jgi:hypothetical protein
MEAYIWDKKTIIKNKKEIKNLFEICYGSRINDKKFGQLYEKNPFGETRGIALKKGSNLIGFYGLIPQRLSKQSTKEIGHIKYLLGISLMIAPTFRGISTLSKIMKKMNAHVDDTDFVTVLGFPNEQSYFPLTTIFGWSTLTKAEFFKCTLEDSLSKTKDVRMEESNMNNRNKWCVPYEDKSFMEWKGICNSYNIVEVDEAQKIVYKIYEGKIDIMDVKDMKDGSIGSKSLKKVAKEENVSEVIITDYHAGEIGARLEKYSKWDKGKIRLCSSREKIKKIDVHLSLLMSDIF